MKHCPTRMITWELRGAGFYSERFDTKAEAVERCRRLSKSWPGGKYRVVRHSKAWKLPHEASHIQLERTVC